MSVPRRSMPGEVHELPAPAALILTRVGSSATSEHAALRPIAVVNNSGEAMFASPKPLVRATWAYEINAFGLACSAVWRINPRSRSTVVQAVRIKPELQRLVR